MAYTGPEPLPVVGGGTGLATITSGNLLVGNGTSAITTIASSSSGGSSNVVVRDANGNFFGNNISEAVTTNVTPGTFTLTGASAHLQLFTGVTTGTCVLPDATTLLAGIQFELNNTSTGIITVNMNGGSNLIKMVAGTYARLYLISNATSAGSWDVHWLMPTTASYGTAGLIVTGTINSTALTASNIVLTDSSKNLVSTAIPLSVANGGTNATSMTTSSGILKYDGTRLVTSATAKIDSSDRMTNTSQTLSAVTLTTTIPNVTGDSTQYGPILFDTTVINQGSAYASGLVTAGVTGNYLICIGVGLTGLTVSNTSGLIYLVTTAKTYQFQNMNYGAVRDPVSGNLAINASIIVPMTATDTAGVKVLVAGAGKVVGVLGSSSPISYFSVTLLPA